MQFSNGLIAPLIVEPLRYYFSRYPQGSNLYWDEDEKKRTLDIGEVFDFNKIPIQEKPRVVVSRGTYSIGKVGLTDNLAQQVSFKDTLGRRDVSNMVFYQGSAIIYVEARNAGTCELLADMVSHFIVWTRPTLCDSQGWKEFGLPMVVSDAQMIQNEDPNLVKFQVQIQVPWIKEEHWRVRNDGPALKAIIQNVFKKIE